MYWIRLTILVYIMQKYLVSSHKCLFFTFLKINIFNGYGILVFIFLKKSVVKCFKIWNTCLNMVLKRNDRAIWIQNDQEGKKNYQSSHFNENAKQLRRKTSRSQKKFAKKKFFPFSSSLSVIPFDTLMAIWKQKVRPVPDVTFI